MKRAEVGARRYNLSEQARRQSQAREQLRVPVSRTGAQHLGRGRVRVLGGGAPGQKKIYQVRDQQQTRGALRESVSCLRVKLKERVEGQKLNTRARENLCARDASEDLLHHAICSPVAIADGV